jgi:ferredoxin
MKVIVDWDRCEANAVCVRCCPEVFQLEEDDTLTILLDEVPEDLRAQTKNAVRLCPRQALALQS